MVGAPRGFPRGACLSGGGVGFAPEVGYGVPVLPVACMAEGANVLQALPFLFLVSLNRFFQFSPDKILYCWGQLAPSGDEHLGEHADRVGLPAEIVSECANPECRVVS